jgi:hypothetical protein
MLWNKKEIQINQSQSVARRALNACLLACLLYGALGAGSVLAWSPPPPEPSPEPIIPQVDPIPGTPSLSIDLSQTQIKLSWNATQDAEYYPVYAYTGGQWQHIEDSRSTQASYNHQQRGWNLSELQVKVLACKPKPWWVYVAPWEWGGNSRCSDWSNTERASDLPNLPPVASAGDDQEVLEKTTAVLRGTYSFDADGTITAYHWQQIDTGAPIVAINNATSADAMVTLPDLWQDNIQFSFRLTVTDNDNASHQDDVNIIVRPTPGINVAYVAGNTATLNAAAEFSVHLESKPSSDVTIPVASSDESEGMPQQSQLVFTSDNWQLAQTLVVRGTNENVQNGAQNYQILLGAASSYDSLYNGLDPEDIALKGIELTLSEPSELNPLIAGLQADIHPQVVYTGRKELTFSLTNAPSGMTIDTGAGSIYWTPQQADEGQNHTVEVSVTDGDKSASASFQVAVAQPDLVTTQLVGNRLNLVDSSTTLNGVSVTTTDSSALATLEVTKLNATNVPSLPDWITPLTDIFVVRGTFDHAVELRFAIPSLPDNIPASAVRLYSYGKADNIENGFWAPVTLGTSYEGSAQSPVVVIKLAALQGMAVFGYDASESAVTLSSNVLQTVAARQKSNMSYPATSTALSSQTASSSSQSVSCEQAEPPTLGDDYLDIYVCRMSQNPDIVITIQGFGGQTKWGDVTKEALASWLIDAMEKFDNYKLGYEKKMMVTIENMKKTFEGYKDPNGDDIDGDKVLGYVVGGVEKRRIIHLNDNDQKPKALMQATAVHEYFHHAQGHQNTNIAGKELLMNEKEKHKKWLTEGTAQWFEDELYDELNSYTYEGQGKRIAEVGINSKPGSNEKREYQRFSFFKLLNKQCSGFTQDLKPIFNVQSIADDPSGIKNLTSLLADLPCNFGNHLGAAKASSLEAALAYYNYATQFKNNLTLLDANETNVNFSFDQPNRQFSPTWSNSTDNIERTLSDVDFIPAAGAISFYVPEINGNLPTGKKAQLVIESNSEIIVSITSEDSDFIGTNQMGDRSHTWFSTSNKTTYTYNANGTVPKLFVTLVNPSLDNSATGVMVKFKILPDIPQVKLNDTGITWGGNYSSGNNSTCIGETITQQDCSHGRDARAAAGTLTKVGGGAAGFDFTKLDRNGNSLSASATNHRCVRDNHTGLMWEVKTDDGGIHDRDNTYRWGGKTALVTQQARDDGWGGFYNDWDTLVDGSNSESLCGFNDWRVPTLKELMTISRKGVRNPSIDSNYFPNTRSSKYWSSSPYAGSSSNAWLVYFNYGNGSNANRNNSNAVRLVRGGQ